MIKVINVVDIYKDIKNPLAEDAKMIIETSSNYDFAVIRVGSLSFDVCIEDMMCALHNARHINRDDDNAVG